MNLRGDLTEDKIKSIDTPLIMVLAGEDEVADNKASYQVYDKVKT